MNTVGNLLLRNGFKFFKDGTIGLVPRSCFYHSEKQWAFSENVILMDVETFHKKHPKFKDVFFIVKPFQQPTKKMK